VSRAAHPLRGAAQAAVELCWLTCVASELNGEELTRARGVAVLGRLLQRCLAVVPADAPPTAPAAAIAANCLRAFAGMAAFPAARAELAARRAPAPPACMGGERGCAAAPRVAPARPLQRVRARGAARRPLRPESRCCWDGGLGRARDVWPCRGSDAACALASLTA
jgi:hypothetical protein